MALVLSRNSCRSDRLNRWTNMPPLDMEQAVRDEGTADGGALYEARRGFVLELL